MDPEKQVLLRDERPVPVAPKTFETLLILVRHSREIVSKDDLMRELWPDSFVEESNLSQNIFMLRKALGDTPEERRYIVTLPGKGYRFTGEVRTVLQDGQDVMIASHSRSETVVNGPGSVSALSWPALFAAKCAKFNWKYMLAAAIALVLTLATVLYLRLHRVAILGDKDSVVIADFTNMTGDPVFDDTLRQGLAVQLEQSPFLQVVSDNRIQQTLSLMEKPNDARLIPELAREVCERTGSTAVLDGSIASLGSEYVLGLRAKNCHTGQVLAEEQAQVARKEDVLKTLGEMAARVRTPLGESVATLETHNVPLETATTPSLEALKAYSTGMRLNMISGYSGATPHFKRAVELDPQFALAWAHLGLKYSEMGESLLANESTTRAYRLRERASDRERFFIAALYDRQVTGNLEKEQQTLQLWSQTYPRDPIPHALLSGFATQGLGQYEQSVEQANITIALSSDLSPPYVNLSFAYLYMGHLGSAAAALEQYKARLQGFSEMVILRYQLAFLKGDMAGMNDAVAWATGKPTLADKMLNAESLVEAYSGRLQSARSKSHTAVDMAQHAGQTEVAATYQAGQATWEALFGNSPEARRGANSALQLSNGRDAEYAAAFALALAGDSSRSQFLVNDLEERFPEDSSVRFNYLPALRAQLALNRHDARKAIEVLQVAAPHDLAIPAVAFNYSFGSMYPAYTRGLAYLALHQGDAAAAEFQKIIDHRGIVVSDPIGATARVQLARAYAMQGDSSRARAAYEDFLALWNNADADIAIFKQAKTEYAKLQ
jgi:DNA-binding winged helix-turn-helix (wHTH) protein/Tfp pilus assembly protein PilF/TolB-like protein